MAYTFQIVQILTQFSLPQLIFWLQNIGFFLIFVSFILDSHSKLQFITIIALVLLFFFKEHALLALESLVIAIVVISIAKVTKHNDLIPFGVAYVLVSIGEFFYFLAAKANFGGGMNVAGAFLYIFAAVAFTYWLWQYLVIRFNLKHSVR